MYIGNDAAIDFYVISTISLENKLITDIEYNKRLTCLREMLGPESKKLKGLILHKIVESMTIDEKKVFEGNEINNENDFCNSNRSEFENIDIETNKDSDLFSFTTMENGIHDTKWRFYEGDRDHTPSIPHGHSIKKDSIVLNPFTREVFPENNRKEDKRLIKNLWNNRKFVELVWKNLHLHLDTPGHEEIALRYKKLIEEKLKTSKYIGK